MYSLFQKADDLSRQAIDAAIEVHRALGPGLIESIYEKCLMRELSLRNLSFVNQQLVRIEMCSGNFAGSQGATFELHEAARCASRIDFQFPRIETDRRRRPNDSSGRQPVKTFSQKRTKRTKDSKSSVHPFLCLLCYLL
jgi:hypothetical protein